ncbi:MAG TPA: homoserine O-succinyltransferase [Aestuariivirga sp.]|jgi:homoserine O-succinyltransferase|nr:homoserine O-succinyltransferase [Hyphomicrobiales bacterium]HQY74081.1 homoserine O-succinyltransferase [Aestuariivirga sp.]HRA93718.1 homoserine O-succinyltransferase [Aestuariivirga sp.]
MPIKIPNDLPARLTLEKEGVMLMTEDTAHRQDIRALRIGLLNLMPNKIKTETQFARLIGATPLQVELSLIKITNHKSKNTPHDHMITFYRDWEKVRKEKFDGLIITGAPIELLEFEAVTYWDELQRIFEWTQTNVQSTFNICWGAQAALYHFHRVPKHALAKKAFGIYRHKNLSPASPYLRGFSDDFSMPVSRWTENLKSELPADKGLEVLMESEEAGLCFVADNPHRQLYMFNHIEYDTNSLGEEYRRDVEAGKAINLPANYFPGGNPSATPENRWRSHAHLLFGNWINEVYQSTPFKLEDIGKP